MMAVFAVVFLILGVARGAVIRMGAVRVAAVVMAMLVETRARDVLSGVSLQADRRRPGELERHDEHDDQGDKATHGGHSTDFAVFTKRPVDVDMAGLEVRRDEPSSAAGGRRGNCA